MSIPYKMSKIFASSLQKGFLSFQVNLDLKCKRNTIYCGLCIYFNNISIIQTFTLLLYVQITCLMSK